MSPTIHLPKVATTPVEALTDAKDILLTDGWVTGDWKCKTGARCAAGALRAAAGHYEIPDSFQRDEAYTDTTYAEAVIALASAIKKTWYLSRYASKAEYERVTLAQRAQYAEDYVADYNDGRVNTTVGRNAVLRRFDKAVANLSS